MLPFFVDLVLLVIIAIGIILGIRRGFIASVAKPLRRILAIAIAFGCASSFGAVLIQPHLSTPIITRVTDILYSNCPDITAESAASELPFILRLVANMAGVDVAASAAGASDVIEALVNVLAQPIVSAASTAISFVILFLLSNLILRLLFYILDKYSRQGVFGVITKAIGCVVNLLLAFSIDWLLVSIFSEH